MDQLSTAVPWPRPLYERRGASQRLRGLLVFYDFPWSTVAANQRTQFRHGLDLARLIHEHCPSDRIPALLLTRDPAEREGVRHDPTHYLVVINIDRYRSSGGGNAAATYFTGIAAVDPIAAASLDLATLTTEQVARLLELRLDDSLLRDWLNVSPDRLARLTALVHDIAPQEALPFVTAQQAAEHLVALAGDKAWENLIGAGAQLPEVLAHRRLWQQYRDQTAVFRTHLRAGDWTEPEWQRFFEGTTWIFGYGLKYQFLHLLQDQPYLGGRQVSRSGGQEGDFLLSTLADVRFTVLVEIKRPDSELVTDALYRNQTHQLGEHLSGGVAQLQQQCWRWAVEGSRTDEARDALDAIHIFTHEPRGILVIGNTASLAGVRTKVRTFESFRSHLRQPEILTFDELLARAEQIVATMAPAN